MTADVQVLWTAELNTIYTQSNTSSTGTGSTVPEYCITTTMVICIEKLQMCLATLGWMLVSGPAATCSAFSVMTGTEMVGLRCQRTLSSLHAHRQTPNLSNICIESNDAPLLLSAVSRRNMIFSSVAFIASQVATKVNADVSDGNALPEGAQQFARTIKLKTDLKV